MLQKGILTRIRECQPDARRYRPVPDGRIHRPSARRCEATAWPSALALKTAAFVDGECPVLSISPCACCSTAAALPWYLWWVGKDVRSQCRSPVQLLLIGRVCWVFATIYTVIQALPALGPCMNLRLCVVACTTHEMALSSSASANAPTNCLIRKGLLCMLGVKQYLKARLQRACTK